MFKFVAILSITSILVSSGICFAGGGSAGGGDRVRNGPIGDSYCYTSNTIDGYEVCPIDNNGDNFFRDSCEFWSELEIALNQIKQCR